MKKIFILPGFILSFALANAQVNPELNKLILQSFQYSPRIQELNKSAEISEIRIDIAESNYLPTVNGTASYSYINPLSQTTIPIGTEPKTLLFQPHNNYNVNVGVTQPIWDFGKTKAQIEKAKTELLLSKQNTESAKISLASQVTGIYYSLVYLRNAIQVQDTLIAFYEKNKSIIEGKVRQGDALSVDVLNIANTIDQEKIRKTDFERQYKRQLALMTYSAGTTIEPSGNEFDFMLASREFDAQSSPDMLAANYRVESSQADSRSAQKARMPLLVANASAGERNGYQPNLDELRFNYLAGVTLTVPIFQGNRLKNNVVIAQKSVQLSEISRMNTNNMILKDWQSALTDLNAYEEQIRSTESQLNACKETLRLTQVRYFRGVATYLDLVFASANLQRAQLAQLQFKYQATLAMAELQRLQGKKFWQE